MSNSISFNEPPYTGNEEKYVIDSMRRNKISGDGYYSRKCEEWFNDFLKCPKSFLTPSCTQALEMAAILIGIKPGDEVILPSYTFVSTANAFVLRGAKIVFVDIRPDTLNLNEKLIEAAITDKTKAIVPVHYAGVGCEMDSIMNIANKHHLYVIEDAAQAMTSTYKDKQLGTFGHLSTFSFHETKNYTSGGEGGLLIINDEKFVERAEIIREKGTNRCKFFRGMIDKYSWVDIGSSYLPSELQSAYLWGQLGKAEEIRDDRMRIWNSYFEGLKEIQNVDGVEVSTIPSNTNYNGHMFYIKTRSLNERGEFISYLKNNNVDSVFHYVPLHSSPAGLKFGSFSGVDTYTTRESERIVRLPLYYGLKQDDIKHVINVILKFYQR